jgi:hypothetical protein
VVLEPEPPLALNVLDATTLGSPTILDLIG